ncbi:hypothetical protein KRMM14A1259_06380 [Krasilnikovia sp. MM14-A1259]
MRDPVSVLASERVDMHPPSRRHVMACASTRTYGTGHTGGGKLQQNNGGLPRREPGSHFPANVLLHGCTFVGRARVLRQRNTWSTDERTLSRLIEALRPETAS